MVYVCVCARARVCVCEGGGVDGWVGAWGMGIQSKMGETKVQTTNDAVVACMCASGGGVWVGATFTETTFW